MFGTAPLLAANSPTESMVKVAFIYNFVKFTEWPGLKNAGNMHKVNVCVLGENNFSDAAALFKEVSTAQLAISMTQITGAGKAKDSCEMVFISQSEEEKITEHVAALKGIPVLTISDIPNFSKLGGMIEFVSESSKVKIKINNRAVNQAGLKLDAQLLEIALSVTN